MYLKKTHLGWVPGDLKDDKRIEAWKKKNNPQNSNMKQTEFVL